MARSNVFKIEYPTDQSAPTIPPMSDEPSFEIELEEDGEVEIPEEAPQEVAFDANLADQLDPNTLSAISTELMELFQQDLDSREDWENIVKDGIDLLGFKIEHLSSPFEGACGASHPLLAQSVVNFQARAFKELFPSGGPAKTKVLGSVTPEKEEQAQRVKTYLNYQTTVEMVEYGPELDRLLFSVGFLGTAFKKTYYDHVLGRPCSKFIGPKDFVIDYYATDLETCDRYTHVMTAGRNDIVLLQNLGIYRRVNLDAVPAPSEDNAVKQAEDELQGLSRPAFASNVYELLEMHVSLDLPGFEDEGGLSLPYIVTLVRDTGEILSIRRNFRQNDRRKRKRVWFVPYKFVPGLGFYGYGYIHLIGGLSKTATSTLRQLLDAGTFANFPAGFKAAGLRVLAPDDPIAPGEWREVNALAGDLSRSLVPLPYKEPSPTLMKLLEFVVGTAKDFAASADQVVQDASNYGPVGTTMALLEQSTKLYSSVHKRLHASQAQDLKLLAEINAEFLPNEYPYTVQGAKANIKREDFDPNTVDVVPVSDPNMPTESHRIAKQNAILQIAATDPSAHNMNAIRLDLYRAMGVEEPERYLAQGQQPFSGDPITENSMALTSKPLSARPEQNHDAHVAIHAAILSNPAYAESMALKSIMAAHIQEHLALKYKMDMVTLIGDPMLAEAIMSGKPLPPEADNMISLAAQTVSEKLNKIDEAKAKILAGEESDPLIELQRMELRIKELELNMRAAVEKANLEFKYDKLQFDTDKLIVDDLNTDLDREAKVKIAKMQETTKNAQAVQRMRTERGESPNQKDGGR